MKKTLEYAKICLLAIIAVCGIILVLQGFGFGTQTVHISSGRVSAIVDGVVSVNNTVDVNLEQVIGHQVGCHKSYTYDGEQYYSIDVN